jgi:hypothetical protein
MVIIDKEYFDKSSVSPRIAAMELPNAQIIGR